MTKYSLYGNATYGVDELRSKRVLAMLGFRLSSGLSGDVNREIPLLNKHIEYFRFIDDLLNYSSSDYLSSFVNGVNLSDRYLICENSCFRIYEGVGDGRYQLSLYANKEYLFGGSDKLSVEAILLLKYLIDGIYDNQEELPYLINKDANKYSYRNSRGSTIRNWASFLNGHIKSYGYVVKRRVNTFSLHKIAR
jgi:hypothetical protein